MDRKRDGSTAVPVVGLTLLARQESGCRVCCGNLSNATQAMQRVG